MNATKINELKIGDRVFLCPAIAAVKRADDPEVGGKWEIIGGDLLCAGEVIRDGQILTGITLGSIAENVERDHF